MPQRKDSEEILKKNPEGKQRYIANLKNQKLGTEIALGSSRRIRLIPINSEGIALFDVMFRLLLFIKQRHIITYPF